MMLFNRRSTLLCFLALFALSTSFSQPKRYKGGLRKPKPANFVNAIMLTGQIGGSSYYGDLRKKVTNFDFKHNLFFGAQYRTSESLSIRAEAGWFRIGGTDEGGENAHRNLSFRTDCYEINAVAIYDMYHQYKLFHKRHLINPYGFLGIGVVFFSPTAEYDGERYKLRPIQTEGQKYGVATLALPVGIGFRIKYSPHISFAVEGRYTWTRTDYLDDVSTTYVGDDAFDDPVAQELADKRTYKSLNGTPGGTRGDPNQNDGYFIFGVRLEYVLKVPRQSYNINKNPSRFRVIKSIKKR